MKKKGQALVEFVIILPIVIFLFFGAVDFGRIILRTNELETLTSDVIDLYKNGSSYEEINKFLKETNKDNTLEVKNKNNEYVEFNLKSKINFITPGLSKILGKDYEAKVKRVIYYEK